jgi:GNAT superfamily N-acetyltransferase
MRPLEAVLAPVSEMDFRHTYAADVILDIDDSKTTIDLTLLEKTTDGNRVICTVSFRNAGGEPILERDLERWLCDNKRLSEKRGRARVACRVKFYARSNYRRQGFGQYILTREEDLFRRWGAKQIHVTAMDEGRWAWTREKFGYTLPSFDLNLLKQRYIEWQRENGLAPIIHAGALSEFPKEFLLSAATHSLPLYKDLSND